MYNIFNKEENMEYMNDAYLEGFMDCLEEFGILEEGILSKVQNKKYNKYISKGGKLSFEKWSDSDQRKYEEYRNKGGKLSFKNWKDNDLRKYDEYRRNGGRLNFDRWMKKRQLDEIKSINYNQQLAKAYMLTSHKY